MLNHFEIRLAKVEDAEQLLKIYKPFVEQTVVSFEYEVPSLEEFKKRIESISQKYPWLVFLNDDEIIGYAFASDFRYREAYQWSVESTVYIHPKFQSLGIGTKLYAALFSILKLQGYVNVFAGLVIPNEASEKLHIKLGFTQIGVYKNIGYKLNKWHSTKWYQLNLMEHLINPKNPKSIFEIIGTKEFKNTLLQHSNLSK